MRDFVAEATPIRDLSHLLEQHEGLLNLNKDHTWIYRGESFRQMKDKEWLLRPSLERALRRYGITDGTAIEYWLLREFKRRLHHYNASVPEKWDTVEWFSLMQHHGAPTRMLDWTYSPFVAAFNALLTASDEYEAIIWCCNTGWFRDRSLEILKGNGISIPEVDDPFRQTGNRDAADFFNLAFSANDPKPDPPRNAFVAPTNSYRLNERLTIQQGVFLVPGNIAMTFHENLLAMDKSEDRVNLRKHFRQWVLQKGSSGENHRLMLRQLARMNVSEASLYPGLDGFSRSLRLNWRILGR